MASPTLKRSREATPSSSAIKRRKSTANIDSSGRNLYYVYNFASVQLGLPAISLRSLLSQSFEERLSDAKAALILTQAAEEGMVASLKSACKGRLLVQSNDGTEGNALRMRGGLWLVQFSDRLRVVITTTKLQQWDVKRLLHTIWVQDFPLGYNPCDFSFTLARFVYSLITPIDLETALGINLGKFNFSEAAVDLITTVPGVYPANVRLGLLQLAGTVPAALPFSGLLASTTEVMKDYSLLFSLQAQLNLPKYTDILIGYPSLQQVSESLYGLGGGGFAEPFGYTLDPGLYSDLCLKQGLSPSGRSALPGYNFLVLGGDMIPEGEMVIYCGGHAFTAEDWGTDLGNGHWRYENHRIGVVFKRSNPDQTRKILDSIPYALSERLDQDHEPWQPHKHLLYL